MGSELRDITTFEIIIPSAGDSVDECQIAKWHVEDGAQVEYGDKIVTLHTDKISQEIESEYNGKIALLASEKQTLAIGATIAKILSSEEDLRNTEKKKVEVAITKPATEKPSSSSTLLKLGILVLLAFVLVKYGEPLMNQISKKSVEILNKEEGEKAGSAEEAKTTEEEKTSAPTKPSIRITKGYEAWEPNVREQLDEWIEDGTSYKLLSIEFNESKVMMEIRYMIFDKEGISSKEKMLLGKDGFGERYIYVDGDREFLVYPPE